MYNYHAGLIWIIDVFLFCASLLLFFAIIVYSFLKDISRKTRAKNLSELKRRVYETLISGKTGERSVCAHFSNTLTPEQFIDVITNRNRDVAFFNAQEQKFLTDCFISEGRINELKRLSRSANKWRRITAILCLGYAGVAGAANELARGLRDKDEDVVYFSLIALGQIKNNVSAQILLRFLQKDARYRDKVAAIIGSFPAEAAFEAEPLLRDKAAEVRVWMLRIIARLRSERYFKDVLKLAGDNSADVRAAACECLGEFGNDENKNKAVQVLEQRLGDDSWLVRKNAVIALSKIMRAACLPQVTPLINDGSLSVVFAVRDVLIAHAEAARPYLEKLLDSDDKLASACASQALEIAGLLKKK